MKKSILESGERKNKKRAIKEKKETEKDKAKRHKMFEAPLGGVPPPNVFGVRRLAIRKGV